MAFTTGLNPAVLRLLEALGAPSNIQRAVIDIDVCSVVRVYYVGFTEAERLQALAGALTDLRENASPDAVVVEWAAGVRIEGPGGGIGVEVDR